MLPVAFDRQRSWISIKLTLQRDDGIVMRVLADGPEVVEEDHLAVVIRQQLQHESNSIS